MSDTDNLGKATPWQIREFPEVLREDIIKAAKAERVSVSEFVTSRMVLMRDAGWPRELPSNGVQTVKQERGPDPVWLLGAATAVAATGGKVRGLTGWTEALIREARGLPPLQRKAPARRLTDDQTVKPSVDDAAE